MVSLVLLGMFLVLYGTRFVPLPRPAIASSDGILTAMTFNLKFNHPYPDQAIAAIESVEADVVAVQELIPSNAELLRAELFYRYPYKVLEPSQGSVGLLSRYPVRSTHWFYPEGGDRAALHAVLDIKGTLLHVLVFHPLPAGFTLSPEGLDPTGLSLAVHERQVVNVARFAAALEGPVLLMGDLNTSERTPAYRSVAQVLKDAYREAGWGFGFTFPHGLRVGWIPVPGPLVRIDYIFHSYDLRAQHAKVGCAGGSDHCYVVAQISGLP